MVREVVGKVDAGKTQEEQLKEALQLLGRNK